jgi:hypothetical protein
MLTCQEGTEAERFVLLEEVVVGSGQCNATSDVARGKLTSSDAPLSEMNQQLEIILFDQ